MTFIHAWAIALGAVAVGMPLLIHWLSRPRPMRMPLSTVRFVLEVLQQRKAKSRLRDFLVLLLRAMAVLLIAWAFSRPLIGDRPLVSAEEDTRAMRVVLLDVSQSMVAASHGIQAFERARSLAAEYLKSRPGVKASVIFAGARAGTVFDRLSTNLGALQSELAQARPRPERLNVQAALALAGEMLQTGGDAPGLRRELVVVSDFQRSNWATADFSALPEDTFIELESVAPSQAPANLGVLSVGTQGRAEIGQSIRLEAEVGNFSSTPRQIQVEVAIADFFCRMERLCPPGTTTTLSREISLKEAGWKAGEARLLGVDDAVAADNSRPFVLQVLPKPTYALITRERSAPQAVSSYFLERALSPVRPRQGQESTRVTRIDSSQVEREKLAAADLFVLDHPGKLSAETIQWLSAFLRRGRAMLYVAAEPVDATNLKLLMDASGSDLQMPVEFIPPPQGQLRRDLFVAEMRRADAPFSIFGDDLSAVMGDLRFSGGLASSRLENGLADDLLASLSDRSALLVLTSCGAGALGILNADLTASNLPASPAFVPLLGELVERLMGRQHSPQARACGEPVAAYLPTEAGAAAALRIVGPEESESDSGAFGSFVEESTGVLWRWESAGAPGAYQVRSGDRTVFALATAIPAEESDLKPLSPSILKERLAGGRKVHFQSATGDQESEDNLWAWFAVACLGCVMLEWFTLKLFRT